MNATIRNALKARVGRESVFQDGPQALIFLGRGDAGAKAA
jgi:hypothetical protein